MPLNLNDPILANIVGWWWAEAGPVANDLINNNDGTFQGTGSPSIVSVGSTGLNAWDFDSANSQAWTALGGEQFRLPGTAWTVAVWARRDGAYSLNWNPIVGCQVNYKGYSLTFSSASGGNYPVTAICGNTASTAWQQASTTGANGLNSTAIWYHFVATYDGATIKVYRDGVEVATAAATGTSQAPPAGTAFSCGRHYSSAQFFNGAIGDVAVWSRRLSPTEVAGWYTSSHSAHAGLLVSTGQPRLLGSRLLGSTLIR